MNNKRVSGTVSIFLLVIIIAVYALGGALVDLARFVQAKSLVLTAQSSALDSVLTGYSQTLRTDYGLFAFQSGEAADRRFEMHLKSSLSGGSAQALYGFDVKALNLSPYGSLMELTVLRKQILEYGKYRYTATIIGEVADKLKAVFQLMKTAIHFSGYMDVKTIECDVVEKDLQVQARLDDLKRRGQIPEGFESAVRNYQDLYPKIILEVCEKEVQLETLQRHLTDLQQELSEMDDTVTRIGPDGEPYEKPNPAKRAVRDKIKAVKSEITSVKDQITALKDEANTLIQRVSDIMPFYREADQTLSELESLAEALEREVPKLLAASAEKDQVLLEENAVDEDPAKSLHDDYQRIEERYSQERVAALLGQIRADRIAVRALLDELGTATANPPPVSDLLARCREHLAGYRIDFDYYDPESLAGITKEIFDRSEYGRFTDLLKDLMQAARDRIQKTVQAFEGDGEDPLETYGSPDRLPSVLLGLSAQDALKGRGVFETRSPILGTDAEPVGQGLEVFGGLGEAGAKEASGQLPQNLLTASVALYEEALINEYVIDHFNPACSNQVKNPEAFWNAGEVEYVIFGQLKPRANIRMAEASIFAMRLLPNTISYFVFKKAEMDAVATALTAPFPALFPILQVALPVLAGTAESAADVKLLHQGHALPLFKLEGELLLNFEFKSMAELNDFLEVLIDLIGTKAEFHALNIKGSDGAEAKAPIVSDTGEKTVEGEQKGTLSSLNIQMDYEDYLRLLLFSMSATEKGRKEKIARIADLIHLNVEKKMGIFDLAQFYTGISSRSEIDMSLWFLSSELYRQWERFSGRQLLQLSLDRVY
jgi:hypothetical protein